MARATKLTPAVSKALLDAVRMGATHRLACQYAGISDQTLLNWRERGAAGEQPFLDFLDAFTRAQGSSAVALLAKIEAASSTDWRAAAWKLQHLFPADYGDKLKISGDADHPLTLLHALPDAELDALIQRRLREAGYDGGHAAFPLVKPEEEGTA